MLGSVELCQQKKRYLLVEHPISRLMKLIHHYTILLYLKENILQEFHNNIILTECTHIHWTINEAYMIFSYMHWIVIQKEMIYLDFFHGEELLGTGSTFWFILNVCVALHLFSSMSCMSLSEFAMPQLCQEYVKNMPWWVFKELWDFMECILIFRNISICRTLIFWKS